MANYDPKQMTEEKLTPMQVERALRQCAYSVSCDGCPYWPVHRKPDGNCIKALMGDAAEAMAKIQSGE